MNAPSLTLLYTPFPDSDSARRAATALVAERLVACCNLLPGMQSIYRWEGAVTEASETVLLAKTTPAMAGRAMQRLAALHPYDTPAILCLPVSEAHPEFVAWVGTQLEASLTD